MKARFVDRNFGSSKATNSNQYKLLKPLSPHFVYSEMPASVALTCEGLQNAHGEYLLYLTPTATRIFTLPVAEMRNTVGPVIAASDISKRGQSNVSDLF